MSKKLGWISQCLMLAGEHKVLVGQYLISQRLDAEKSCCWRYSLGLLLTGVPFLAFWCRKVWCRKKVAEDGAQAAYMGRGRKIP